MIIAAPWRLPKMILTQGLDPLCMALAKGVGRTALHDLNSPHLHPGKLEWGVWAPVQCRVVPNVLT